MAADRDDSDNNGFITTFSFHAFFMMIFISLCYGHGNLILEKFDVFVAFFKMRVFKF